MAKVAPKVVAFQEPEEVDNRVSFGFQRGTRREVSLELRKLNGDVFVLKYSYISGMIYSVEEGVIRIHLPERVVQIRGLRLNAQVDHVCLLNALGREKVPWIMELNGNQILAAGNRCVVIESIDWEVE